MTPPSRTSNGCVHGGCGSCGPPMFCVLSGETSSGGPPPVRTLLHPTGIPHPSVSQARELETSALLHSRTRHLLHLVAGRGGLIWLENPSSSLLWLDPAVTAWCRLTAPFMATVAACQVGLQLHNVLVLLLQCCIRFPACVRVPASHRLSSSRVREIKGCRWLLSHAEHRCLPCFPGTVSGGTCCPVAVERHIGHCSGCLGYVALLASHSSTLAGLEAPGGGRRWHV